MSDERANAAADEHPLRREHKSRQAERSLAAMEIAEASQKGMLTAWLQDIQRIPLPQMLEGTSDEQLQALAKGPLQELTTELGSKECQELFWLTPADLVTLLRAITSWCQERGFAPAQARALFLSLKHALLRSQRDELTGLYNRRAFFTLAEQQLKVARRSKIPLALLFGDIDRLKWINDNLGHPQGDLVLIDAASVLRHTFRDSDIIARIGGDEFVVLAAQAGQNAEVLTARLEKQFRAHAAKRKSPCQLSMSVGVAHYDPESPCSLDELLVLADAKMYQQKRKRRKFRQSRRASPASRLQASSRQLHPAEP